VAFIPAYSNYETGTAGRRELQRATTNQAKRSRQGGAVMDQRSAAYQEQIRTCTEYLQGRGLGDWLRCWNWILLGRSGGVRYDTFCWSWFVRDTV